MLRQNSNRKTQIYNADLKSHDVKVRAYNYALEIIKFVNKLPNQRTFWTIGDQLLQASTSKEKIRFEISR